MPVTFLDIKDTLNKITTLTGWHFDWSYCVVNNGIVCIAFPHPISPDGGHIPDDVIIRNKLYYYDWKTWNDVFKHPDFHILDARIGYERCMIFAFTDASFNMVGQGNERVNPSDLSFLNERYVTLDHDTKIGIIKRDTPCNVYTFTFKYDDVHKLPVLEPKPEALTHLTITGILDHFIMKWH